MSNRQKIYVGLAISAGVCSSIALLLYIRHRRKLNLSKTPHSDDASVKPSSFLSPIRKNRDQQYTDIRSSPDENNADTQTVKFVSSGATVGVDIAGGCIQLTKEQAIVLTRYLDESINDIERLHRILTNIANSSTLKESQVNLADAGCIERLRHILSTTNNDTTKVKTLLALNNLALNTYTIKHFAGLVTIIINLCLTIPSNSPVRLYGLNLLLNMSVLEYLHDEYMKNMNELDLLIKSTFENGDEILSIGKVLVNLSTNISNLENLLKLTSVELKTIVTLCTPTRKSMNNEELAKLEDILLRYLNFYCNMADMVINVLQKPNESTNTIRAWLIDPKSCPQDSVYFELFDHDKQMSMKSILRPQYSSNIINNQIKRLRQSLDTIRQMEFDASVLSVHDEFNEDDSVTTITDFSTPRRTADTSTIIIDDNQFERSFDDLAKEVAGQFDEDNTILADQSSNSFCSAYSANETNNFTSPDKSISN